MSSCYLLIVNAFEKDVVTVGAPFLSNSVLTREGTLLCNNNESAIILFFFLLFSPCDSGHHSNGLPCKMWQFSLHCMPFLIQPSHWDWELKLEVEVKKWTLTLSDCCTFHKSDYFLLLLFTTEIQKMWLPIETVWG